MTASALDFIYRVFYLLQIQTTVSKILIWLFLVALVFPDRGISTYEEPAVLSQDDRW